MRISMRIYRNMSKIFTNIEKNDILRAINEGVIVQMYDNVKLI